MNLSQMTSNTENVPFIGEGYSDIKIVQYNILSSGLSTSEFHVKCTPMNLNPNNRLPKVMKKLETYLQGDYIVTLQEVSRTWLGPLHDFFSHHGYGFITSLYGNRYNDYMGIGIAYPFSKYTIEGTEIVHVGSKIPARRIMLTFRQKLSAKILSFIMFFVAYLASMSLKIRWLSYFKTLYKKYTDSKFDEVGYAKHRPNTMILTTLTNRQFKRPIALATYHNPCAYWAPNVMTLHTSKVFEIAKNYACDRTVTGVAHWFANPEDRLVSGEIPLIFTGDFNFEPFNEPYQMIIDKGMRSAYHETRGKEPEYTIRTHTKTSGFFSGTLDYIFYSGLNANWAVPFDSDSGIFPNDTEPSDHILIGAGFSFI